MKHNLFRIIIAMIIFIMEGLKWLAIIPLIVLAHMSHVHVMENAVNVLHIIAGVEKYQDVSFLNLEKKLMIGQLKISTMIIKRMARSVFLL